MEDILLDVSRRTLVSLRLWVRPPMRPPKRPPKPTAQAIAFTVPTRKQRMAQSGQFTAA